MKKKVLLGILAVTLIFSMVLVGCDGDKGSGDDGNGGTGLPENIQTGDPDTTVLASYFLPNDFMTTIKTAAGGGYEGWLNGEDDDGVVDLQFYWTGRNESQCDAVITAIRTLPSTVDDYGPTTEELSGEQGTGTMRSANGSYQFGAWRYSVIFAVTDCTAWGQSIPQGTLIAIFWEEE